MSRLVVRRLASAVLVLSVGLTALSVRAEVPAPPRLSARVALVADLDSDEVLFLKGGRVPHSIASISKLMAILVALEHGVDLEGETELTREDRSLTSGGSRSRLIPGRTYRNRDLLHAALMGSDNRAVLALGRAAGLSFSEFVRAMNEKAAKLGLPGVHFEDPTGIDHGNVASAIGVLGLLEAALGRPELASVTRERRYRTAARERSGRPLEYRNTNLLVHDESREVLVGKTGFNSSAGWCVATAVRLEDGHRIGIVVLGTATKHMRFRDAKRLERWARASYEARRKAAEH